MKIFNKLETTYSEYLQSIRTYLSIELPKYGRSFTNASIFGQIINVFAAGLEYIMSYIEDALTEQNKLTAQRKKSIYGLAAMTGYQANLGTASAIKFTMNFVPNNINNLTYLLKNKTRITCTQNALTYNIILPQEVVVFNTTKDNTVKELFAVEGTFETQEFLSTGGQLYSVNVPFNGNCDINYLEVRVNNELWTRMDSMYDMSPNATEYTVRTSLSKGFDIVFGNDTYGRALKENDKISVTYLLHNGEQGNIDYSKPVHVIFQDDITDTTGEQIDADEVFNIIVSNQSANNGTNSDSTDLVRELIGYNSRAMVLADAKNYELFIKRFSFCGYSRTWSEEGSLVVNSIILKNYSNQLDSGDEYFDLKVKDFILTDTQKDTIKSAIAMSGQQLAGTVLNIFDPEIVKYACYIYLKMKQTTFDKDYVESSIKKLVGEFMAKEVDDRLIPKSDIVHLIKDNIASVDSVDVYFISERNETALINGYYYDKIYKYNSTTKTYDVDNKKVRYDEDLGLGLDAHGNIITDSVFQFPILAPVTYRNTEVTGENQLINADALTIIYE